MAEYFSERRAIWPLTDGRKRAIFLDNCGGHGEAIDSTEVLSRIRTTVRYPFPIALTSLSLAIAF
jgi:hypothetical protein